MGRTADLAQDIITMVKEYNRCIRDLQSTCDSLESEHRYYKDKYEQSRKTVVSLELTINEYKHKLDIVTDVISKHMEQSGGIHYISSMYNLDPNSSYMKIIKALEIPLSIDEVNE